MTGASPLITAHVSKWFDDDAVCRIDEGGIECEFTEEELTFIRKAQADYDTACKIMAPRAREAWEAYDKGIHDRPDD